MLYDLGISWRSIRANPVQSFIPALIIALAVALSITVLVLGDGVREGIIRASDPFGVLVIGAKGDTQQLVLNSILLQGVPIGTIPYEIYQSLAADPRVRLAVPLAKGDSIGGIPLIGTDAAFFELRTNINALSAFRLAQGSLFDQDFQAVLGSGAAETLGLGVGNTFRASHGLGRTLASDQHEQVYTVVGILGQSNTPFDRAVFTTINSIWRVHETEEDDPLAALSLEESGASDRLTSVFVAPVGFVEQNQVWQEFYTRTDAQAAFPGQELVALFELLSQGERILTFVGYLVLVIAALTVFLAMYNVTLNRQQEIAVMRSLGSSRATIFRMVIFETLVITVIGALAGRIIGYAAAALIGAVLSGQSAIPIPTRFLFSVEPLLWLVSIGVGVIAGLIPAMQAYSVDVVKRLFSS